MHFLRTMISKTVTILRRYVKDSERDPGPEIRIKMKLRVWRNLRSRR